MKTELIAFVVKVNISVEKVTWSKTIEFLLSKDLKPSYFPDGCINFYSESLWFLVFKLIKMIFALIFLNIHAWLSK